jgi:hypothetical protein
MKKQTAVEWVLDWMSKNQYFIGNDLLKAVEQAKEMEKQQSIELLTKYHDGLFYVPFKDGEAEAIYNHLTNRNESNTKI